MQTKESATDPRVAGMPAAAKSPLYFLALLTIVYSLNFLDRTVMNILIDPIKAQYHLSDTVMGLIAGFGFTLLYSILAAPVARWADRGNRRSIIALGMLVWSAMTALAGLARNAVQFTLSRVGVSIGEAAGTAPSASLISDLYPGERRATAMSIFQLGPVIGGFLGMLIGGWVNQYYGWHDAFLVAGIPGIFVALVLRFTVREPARGSSEQHRVDTRQQGVVETIRYMSRQKSYVLILLGFCLTTYTQFGFGTWAAVFLGRIQHLNTAQIGIYAGTLRGLTSLAGTLGGGYCADWAGRNDVRWKVYVPAIASILAGPGVLLFCFARSLSMCLTGFAVVSMLAPVHVGPLVGVSHSTVKVGMRAFSTSLIYLIAELIGLGVGPFLIGLFDDHYAPRLGVQIIRYSMSTAGLTTMLGGLIFIFAARYVRADSARAMAREG